MKSFVIRILVIAYMGICIVPSASADMLLSWQREKGSLALAKDGQTLWRFNVQRGDHKPYFHPLATADGTALTQAKPADHVWHYGLWFGFKKINGVNFWEEDLKTGLSEGYTQVLKIDAQTMDDYGASFDLEIDYTIPKTAGKPAQGLIKERRNITVSPPDKAGNYHLDFHHFFRALTDVTLDRTPLKHEPEGKSYGGYAGLSFRHHGLPGDWQLRENWQFSAPNPAEKLHGTRQPWVAYSGKLGSGSAGTAIFDHPTNFNHPSKWYTSNALVFYSPAFIFDSKRTLKKKETLTLRYRVKIYSSAPEKKDLEAEWDQFSKKTFQPIEDSKPARDSFGKINLVEHGRAIYAEQCIVCHNNKPEVSPETVPRLGPSFYGLLRKNPAPHAVYQNKLLDEILVDDSYIKDSLLDPMKHIAAKVTPVGSSPYPAAMPRYDYQGDDINGLIAYLRTLNEPRDRGIGEIWVAPEKKPEIDNDQFEIDASKKIRVVRAVFAGVSTRAIAVGDPAGMHYFFDPAWLSVRQVWKGGFVNMKIEHTDRGAGQNALGKGAEPIELGFIVRPLIGNTPVDFSARDFPSQGAYAVEQIRSDLSSKDSPLSHLAKDTAYQGYSLNKERRPTFKFRIDGMDFQQTVTPLENEQLKLDFTFSKSSKPIRFLLDQDKAHISSSAGTISEGILSLPAGTRQLTLYVKCHP